MPVDISSFRLFRPLQEPWRSAEKDSIQFADPGTPYRPPPSVSKLSCNQLRPANRSPFRQPVRRCAFLKPRAARFCSATPMYPQLPRCVSMTCFDRSPDSRSFVDRIAERLTPPIRAYRCAVWAELPPAARWCSKMDSRWLMPLEGGSTGIAFRERLLPMWKYSAAALPTYTAATRSAG